MGGYSVAIRTLGRAGDKYKRLLDSISRSKRVPDKIVVVLPEGYKKPDYCLGNEQIVYCTKSMIGQRIEALKYIESEYTLFLDDDIEFDEEFVDKVLKPLETDQYDCATGPLFSFFPATKLGRIAGTLTGSVSVSLFHRNMYVKILRTGGWSYHTFDTTKEKYYPTESFAWTCFAIKTDVMRQLRMEDEQVWLERFGCACGDDRVMAYKLIKKGYKACIVANAIYTHNDAKTSTAASEMDSYKPKFCMYYMHTVFWHRFIQELEKSKLGRIINVGCFNYWRLATTVYHLLKASSPDGKLRQKAYKNGVKEGLRYINSKEYSELKDVLADS